MHQFLVITECPIPLSGRDILSKVKILVIFSTDTKSPILIMTLVVKRGADEIDTVIDQELNHQHWAMGTPGQAHRAKPAMIRLKDPNKFPNKW